MTKTKIKSLLYSESHKLKFYSYLLLFFNTCYHTNISCRTQYLKQLNYKLYTILTFLSILPLHLNVLPLLILIYEPIYYLSIHIV